MKDEDLDLCPRCKEDMWAGQKLCRNCTREDELEEWSGGEGIPFTSEQDDHLNNESECDVCGHISTDDEGRHHCWGENSDD